MSKSSIEWTNATWNPLTGCDQTSPGCKNCYAKRMAHRLQAMGQPNYRNGFKLTLQPHMLEMPLHWREPKLIFVNSMSDLFHKDVPENYLLQVFEVMNKARQDTFQVLTKRSERLLELSSRLSWTPNIWQGVSVENADYLFRVDHLRQTGARTKFLSCEPLIGPLDDLDLKGVHWVITGGESGPKSRPCEVDWVRTIRDKCIAADVAFFHKQWGGVRKKQFGNVLDGKVWHEYPPRLG